MPGRKNCSRFTKMLPKLVVLCSLQSEEEISRAGYIASKSSHPDTAYFCQVCNLEYGDEVCQAFPVPPSKYLFTAIINKLMILRCRSAHHITCGYFGNAVPPVDGLKV